MRYSSYKPDENVWQMEVHETKNRTLHRVPMNRHALEIMAQVKPYTGACPYVFGATRAFSPPNPPNPDLIPPGRSAFSQAIRRSREAIGVEDFCPHDLRRTGATWITASGLPKLYARLMLNHSDGERDVSLPWYRPTRLFQIMPAGCANNMASLAIPRPRSSLWSAAACPPRAWYPQWNGLPKKMAL